MDKQLTQLLQKMDKLPMTVEERMKYLDELSLRVRAKLLDTIYQEATAEEKKQLNVLSSQFDIEKYADILKSAFQNRALLEKLQKTYIETLEKEIQQFP